ncbi:MAG: dienelactone hydrolase family protein [Acetobacteraceae bacterium]|nr:dienelactone hydrolase family protein [Acetobacteraceae bacterium]MBV8522425.1 dienelactone hydrolase family protein [Acetobacteraceae bacterium]MBV8591160.1 dienelactone hydrolase family protein [Acetobacteraceae bacterium]
MSIPQDVQPVRIEPEGLDGFLGLAEQVRGVVIFAHGSGSGRFSPRNNFVAAALRSAGLGTFLLDLLSHTEERDRRNVFNIGLLANRLALARSWIKRHAELAAQPIFYFGASTGAAAALAAAARDQTIAAVVSRGGRPDLAMDLLGDVRAPTLLIVGGWDHAVIDLNREAYERLTCEKRLVIVPQASHLFEEPGKLDEVVKLATEWFQIHLNRPVSAGAASGD